MLHRKTYFVTLVLLTLFCVVLGSCSAQAAPRHAANALFPASSLPARIIDVVDLVDQPADTKLTMITLQGHINSGAQAKVCFKIWGEGVGNTPITFWPGSSFSK